MKLGEYIKSEGISQAFFSVLSGIHPSTLSRYISGDKSPSLYVLSIIHKCTKGKVSPCDFFDDAASLHSRRGRKQSQSTVE